MAGGGSDGSLRSTHKELSKLGTVHDDSAAAHSGENEGEDLICLIPYCGLLLARMPSCQISSAQ